MKMNDERRGTLCIKFVLKRRESSEEEKEIKLNEKMVWFNLHNRLTWVAAIRFLVLFLGSSRIYSSRVGKIG